MNYKFKIYILDEIYICHTLKKKKTITAYDISPSSANGSDIIYPNPNPDPYSKI